MTRLLRCVDSERVEPAVVLAWSVHAPASVGAVAFVERDAPNLLGRAGTLRWIRHRPSTNEPVDGVTDPVVSREQLDLQRLSGGRTQLRRIGRLPVRVNGLVVDEGEVGNGDVIEIGDRVVLLVHHRPRLIDGDLPTHAFGRADARGLVGEGPNRVSPAREALLLRPAVGPRARDRSVGHRQGARGASASHRVPEGQGTLGEPERGDHPRVTRGRRAVRESRKLSKPGNGSAPGSGRRGGRRHPVPGRVR